MNQQTAFELARHGRLPRPEDKPTPRPLYVIALDISTHWPKVNYAAKPYLDAMASLNKITDTYICDPADHIVRYFLANAGTWRGDDAKRIKTELKGMLPY